MQSAKWVKSLATIVLMATGLATVSAATFQCNELEKLIGAADNHFSGLEATVRERETAVDLAARYGATIEAPGSDSGYESVTLAVAQPLSGADDCEIVDVVLVDEEVDQRQTAFRCRYAGIDSISDALRTELKDCLQKPIEPESDGQSLTIWAERVDSGEGYAGIAVEVESNVVEGLTLGIVKTVCLNRSEGGCESDASASSVRPAR